MSSSLERARQAERMMQEPVQDRTQAGESNAGRSDDDAEAHRKAEIHEANLARWDHSPYDPTPAQQRRNEIAAQSAATAADMRTDDVTWIADPAVPGGRRPVRDWK